MPIVIKEVIVKTTVERAVRQESLPAAGQLVEEVKRKVLEELGGENRVRGNRRERKDR